MNDDFLHQAALQEGWENVKMLVRAHTHTHILRKLPGLVIPLFLRLFVKGVFVETESQRT